MNPTLPRAFRATKIIATLGPASSDRHAIRSLALAGVNVFRLNFSHGSHADHQTRFAHIRAVEQELGYPLAILQDLQGPKIRIGVLPNGPMEITTGQTLRFSGLLPVPEGVISFPHLDIVAELEVGHQLLIDDGKLRIKVTALFDKGFEALVLVGGRLSDRKGVNVPDTHLSLSALTRKDRDDLAFGLAMGVDWVALSFVQRAKDLIELRQLVAGRAGLLAKIEKPNAITDLDAIVAQADAVMVARGDLGVELPAEDVPTLQRQIIDACRKHGKPVVVATQMLESMINTPTPTRAEASDVANAVYCGADAVMLSAETASGAYPLEAVQMMSKILNRAELDMRSKTASQALIPTSLPGPSTERAEMLAAALRAASSIVPLSCAVTYTTSGASALLVARERAAIPVIGLTPHAATARRLCIAWGVHPCISADAASVEGMVESAVASARAMGLYSAQQPMAVVAGLPFATAGTTNLLRFVWPTAPDSAASQASAALASAMPKSSYFAEGYIE
jgi:pyruvate kinase